LNSRKWRVSFGEFRRDVGLTVAAGPGKDLVSIAGGQPTDEGPASSPGSELPRRQNPDYNEWLDGRTSTGADAVSVDPVDEPELGPHQAPLRPLPTSNEADSWSAPPSLPAEVTAYRGLRRADPRPARVRPILVAVLIGLAALVSVPLILLTAHSGGRSSGAVTTGSQSAGPTEGETAPASLAPAMSESAQTTITPSTTRRPEPGSALMTLEAETARIIRPARAISYPGASNGSIVTGIGTSEEDSGSIQFNVVIPAAGSYVITIYFVNLDASTTSADISISDVGTVTQTFAGTSVCCASVALAAMMIAPGRHIITIGNDRGPGPSVDKIVISRV
jgi:hypothetical protein